jgi:hypothetical protein
MICCTQYVYNTRFVSQVDNPAGGNADEPVMTIGKETGEGCEEEQRPSETTVAADFEEVGRCYCYAVGGCLNRMLRCICALLDI